MAQKNSSASQAVTSQTDNLEAIHGIGKAIALRLYGAGIRTCAQLAEMTHEDLYELVQGSRPGLTLNKLVEEDWPGQARRLVAAAAAGEEAAAADSQHDMSFTIKLLLEADNRVRRTIITHTQSGQELRASGWDVDQTLGFMARYAELRSAAPQAAPGPVAAGPTAGPEPPAAPAAHMAQAGPTLAVAAATTRESGSASFSGVLPAGRDWILGVEWTLSGAQADVLDEEWLVEVYLESMGPGPEYVVPAAGPVKKPLREYDEADPAAGRYRYTHEIGVPANSIAPGRYQVVPAICPADPAGRLGPLTGFGAQHLLYLHG